LDESDNAFVTGYTYSTNFPCTTNAYKTSLQCSNTFYINANAFVAEIATNGTTLNYSTFLGGTNFEQGRAIAYNNGMLYVAGYTISTNFPAVNYIPKMTNYQTYYYSNKVSGHYVLTNSIATNYFAGNLLNGASTNKFKNPYTPASDAFVTAFAVNSPTNLTLLYSTYLGGTNDDQANAIAADAYTNVYVAGYTTSTNFPDINNFPVTIPTANGFTLSYVNTNMFGDYSLATNGFLTKISWDGDNTNAFIAYSVMFGGQGMDVANGVALDSAGDAYVVGSATSTNFPVITNNIGGDLSATNHYLRKRFKSDVVVIAFNPDASALLYSAYIGGYNNDFGNAIALDQFGNAYITGATSSTNFPVTIDSSNSISALQPRLDGTNDMFISIISSIISTNSP